MIDDGDTIAAEATPPGKGSLRVVRVSGGGAVDALRALFLPVGSGPWDRPRSLCLGDVAIPGKGVLDRSLAVFFRAPDSLTGQDVFELQLHGSPGVVRGVLDTLVALGVRPALPGEFSFRAVLNGKMTVMEAEAVNALVAAETAGQAIVLSGGEKAPAEKELLAIREALLDLSAAWEARLDFPDDVSGSDRPEGASDLRTLQTRIEAFLAGARASRLLREGWRVALAGPVNSGKSSLFNAFLRRERALVSPHPGTTRDVLEEALQVADYPLVLLDVAGIRETGDPVEAMGVSRALGAAREADAVLFVYDLTAGWTEEADRAVRVLPGPPLLVLANKCDLVPGGKPEKGALPVSALTGQGLREVTEKLADWMEGTAPRRGSALLVSERQFAVVSGAAAGCGRALEALEAGFTEEVAVQGLREALAELAKLFTGGSPEELYDRIFASFCIGK